MELSSTADRKSIVQILNRSGPSAALWATADYNSMGLEYTPFKIAYCILYVKKKLSMIALISIATLIKIVFCEGNSAIMNETL